MDTVLLLNKPIGLTPLQALHRLQATHPELTGVRLGYAGRLDPMADGLLLVLAGHANTQQESLSKLDKVYQVELVLGASTDSYDLLGLPILSQNATVETSRLSEVISDLVGSIDQPYPAYSAVRVQGHPLFWWAKQDRLDEVTIPTKQRHIYAINLLAAHEIVAEDLLAVIQHKVSLVEGDFRQDQIVAAWHTLLRQPKPLAFPTLLIEVHCSSGTYMRSLVNQIGRELNTTAVASRITRIKAGHYTLDQALELN